MSQRYETWSSIHLVEGRECIHNNKVMTYILCFADLTVYVGFLVLASFHRNYKG